MRKLNRDSIPHVVAVANDRLKLLLSTFYMKIKMWWWSIKCPHAYFHGLSVIRRHPESTIIIGKNAVFRSSYTSNMVGLNHPCYISTLSQTASLIIGNNFGISGSVVACQESISIGNNVMIGANCVISDTDFHPISAHERNVGASGKSAPVHIENDVWLGMGVIVLKGVTIGHGSVIAANSTVITNVQPNSLYAGSPAKFIKKLN